MPPLPVPLNSRRATLNLNTAFTITTGNRKKNMNTIHLRRQPFCVQACALPIGLLYGSVRTPRVRGTPGRSHSPVLTLLTFLRLALLRRPVSLEVSLEAAAAEAPEIVAAVAAGHEHGLLGVLPTHGRLETRFWLRMQNICRTWPAVAPFSS